MVSFTNTNVTKWWIKWRIDENSKQYVVIMMIRSLVIYYYFLSENSVKKPWCV
jgi:hypothetical protein